MAAPEAGADVAGAAVVPGAEAAVVPGADVDAADDAVVVAGAAVVAGVCAAVVALPPELSSSPHAAATNASPTATAATRFIRLLITWILLVESQREVVLPLSGARRAVHAVST
jgi:hypothetical protein